MSEKNYLLQFLKRWSILIIIIILFGVLSSNYIIKIKYSNSILMKIEKKYDYSYQLQDEVPMYRQSLDFAHFNNRIIYLKAYLPINIKAQIVKVLK